MRPAFLIGCPYQSNKKKRKLLPQFKDSYIDVNSGYEMKPNTTTRIDKRNFWELALF